MSRKGQLTVYLLIGLVIVGIAFFGIRKYQRTAGETALPNGAQSAKLFLEECLRQSLDAAVRTVSLQGSFVELPDPHIEFLMPPDIVIPYAYHRYDGTVWTPTAAALQAAVERKTTQQFELCTQSFSQPGFALQLSPLAIQVDIQDQHADVVLSSPVQILWEQNRYRLKELRGSVSLPLGKMHALAEEISQQQDQDSWCLTCISALRPADIILNPDFISDDGSTTILYQLIQSDSPDPLIYLFAHRLPFSAPEILPDLPEIEVLEATIGQHFSYQFPKLENVLFADDSPIFDIDAFTGTIAFTPIPEDRGEYLTTIIRKSPSGDIAQEMFLLKVRA